MKNKLNLSFSLCRFIHLLYIILPLINFIVAIGDNSAFLAIQIFVRYVAVNIIHVFFSTLSVFDTWIQSTTTTLESLGILFSNDYNMAINENWENVMSTVNTQIQIMQNTHSTIYQRAVLLNCVIFSKLWYVAHVFPLPIH